MIERSVPAIRAAFVEAGSAGELARFEEEMRAALTSAAADLDLTRVDGVLTRWHALATMAVNPLTDEERDQVARAKEGDLTALRERDGHGDFLTL